jgi:hypothetical protein
MKTPSSTIGIVGLLLFSSVGLHAPKPDFSGAWVMDRSRSFGLPGNMNQTMEVAQTGDRIDVETKLIQPDNERSVKDTYVLDGKEHEFTPQAPPGQTPPKGKRTANWLGDRGIIVDEVTTSETPKGPATTKVTRKWTLSSNGELIIDMYVDAPTISYEAKRIFTRK